MKFAAHDADVEKNCVFFNLQDIHKTCCPASNMAVYRNYNILHVATIRLSV